MKKLVSLSLVLCFVFLFFTEIAAEDNVTSAFEQAQLTKGSILKKEFIDISVFKYDEGKSDEIKFEAAVLTDMKSNTKFYALRLSSDYYNSQYDKGTMTSVLELGEIDSIVTTLEIIKKEFETTPTNYTEYNYQSISSSGFEIGAYNSWRGNRLYIQFDRSNTISFSFDKVLELIDILSKAKQFIGELSN